MSFLTFLKILRWFLPSVSPIIGWLSLLEIEEDCCDELSTDNLESSDSLEEEELLSSEEDEELLALLL